MTAGRRAGRDLYGTGLLLLVLAVAGWATATPDAASASTVSFGVRDLHIPRHGVRAYADPTASGGRAVVFTRHVAVTSGRARFGATGVGVWVSANRCHGVARVALRIDHRLVLRAPVHSRSWKELRAPVGVRHGWHVVQVALQNPLRTSTCQRRLRLNKVVLWNAPDRSRRQLHLVFDDEFNGNGLDTTKWNPLHWNAQNGFYDPSNALVEGGLLRLRASSSSSSAMVQTLGKFQLTYGRVEASIRVPSGQGFWPAFWLMPAAVGTLDLPEIDVLEMWMTDRTDDLNDSQTVSQNYHWQDSSGQRHQQQSYVRGPTNYAAGFHRFGLVWDSHSIRWYIDGVQTKEVTGPIVSRTPMFIILSLQIGNAPWLPGFAPNASTPFPSYMDVDWVHIYQR
jgi:beta-glucanase (GH16 family)